MGAFMETLWSNADAVVEFLEQHRERRYVVGDYVVLPDIGQRYDVVAVRPFRRDGRLFMFLDLEAVCAVEGCGSVFRTDMEVNRWRKGRKLRRCCPEHQYQFRTSMRGAWQTIEERDARELLRFKGGAARPTRRGLKQLPKIGPVQRVLMSVLEDYEMVGTPPTLDALVEFCAERLPPPADGLRDTRRQRSLRAYRIAVERKLIEPVAGDA